MSEDEDIGVEKFKETQKMVMSRSISASGVKRPVTTRRIVPS
jgi:hypothetical protein